MADIDLMCNAVNVDSERENMRKNLVIVRAGNSSLHSRWLQMKVERNWDIVVNYFGDDPDIYKQDDVVRIDSKGPKWPALHDLLVANQGWLESYEYIWFPDDDLDANGCDINLLFDSMRDSGVSLAQPSLSTQSYISHWITLRNEKLKLRQVNFIEVMAPCMSRAALKKLFPTFNENMSGWGLDYLWPMLLDGSKCVIFDDISVTHTRPVGGPNYASIKAQGLSAEDEKVKLLAKYGIDLNFRKACDSLVTKDGREIDLASSGYIKKALTYLRFGMPDELYGVRCELWGGVGRLIDSALQKMARSMMKKKRVELGLP